MKHRILAAVVSLMCTGIAAAQQVVQPDPCQLLSPDLIMQSSGNASQHPGCMLKNGAGTMWWSPEFEVRLAAQTVVELRTLVGEIRGLRSEMQSYAAGLDQAKAKFDATTNSVAANQETWRKEALNETLAQVAAIPARLGTDPGLREALLETLKVELAKDRAFVEAVHQATKNPE